MKCWLTVLACSLFLIAPTYTLTTDATTEAALTHAVSKANAERARRSPPLPALSNQQYVDLLWQGVLASYGRTQKQDDRVVACTTFKNLSRAEQDAITTQLGGKAPCE